MKLVFKLIFSIIVTNNLFAQLPKGDRSVGLQVDMTENNNYDSAYSYALATCMQSTHLAFSWKAMEPTSENISGSVFELLDIVDIYYPAYGTQVELNIPVVNTVTREVPTDLELLPFSDSIMIARFKTLLDSIFVKIPNVTLKVLSIGNESDIMWGNNPTKYQDFKIFLDSVSVYAKELYFNLHGTNLNVGTTLTYEGLTQAATATYCQQLNSDVDVISITYYGIDQTGMVIPPANVIAEFSALIAMYPDTSKPIFFAECGYPSSPTNGSSFELQRQFITQVFTAWDNHYDNIKHISFFKTTDWSQADVDTLAVYYGLPNDSVFKEYLRTLGLRTYPINGSNKPAYEQLKCELDDRLWCSINSTNCGVTGIEQQKKELRDFTIFPNPSSQTVNFLFENDNSHNIELLIHNLQGKTVAKIESSPTNSLLLNVEYYPSGMYFYTIKFGKQTVGKGKIIKE